MSSNLTSWVALPKPAKSDGGWSDRDLSESSKARSRVSEAEVQLRPATPADARTIFEWRNDPFLIARSTSGNRVAWEQHRAWFEESLKGTVRRIFVITWAGQSVGQVRFDLHDPHTAVISVYVLEAYVGKGIGIAAIHAGCAWVWRQWAEVSRIVACVRMDNQPARSAFGKAGFEADSNLDLCPQNHWSFVLKRG